MAIRMFLHINLQQAGKLMRPFFSVAHTRAIPDSVIPLRVILL